LPAISRGYQAIRNPPPSAPGPKARQAGSHGVDRPEEEHGKQPDQKAKGDGDARADEHGTGRLLRAQGMLALGRPRKEMPNSLTRAAAARAPVSASAATESMDRMLSPVCPGAMPAKSDW
jgi:hypothetical protein